MIDPADIRFFEALHKVCEQSDDVGSGCKAAAARAAKTGQPLDLSAARKAVDALEDHIRDRLLRTVHRQMATDISAIWDALPSAPKDGLPN